MDGLIAKNLCKSYPGTDGRSFSALRNVSVSLLTGSCTALVGESGSGKSTLARLLTGMERPDRGQILLDGEDATRWNWREWRSRRKKLQAVFQDTAGTLNPRLSPLHNVEEAMVNLTDLNASQRRSRIEELMALTHMDLRLLETPVRQLSGGEQRRLSLLRALAIRPQYLILDEVLSGLDLISADAVMTLLERYRQEYECTILLVTHDMDSAYRLSDTILTMHSGQIVRTGIKNTQKGTKP